MLQLGISELCFAKLAELPMDALPLLPEISKDKFFFYNDVSNEYDEVECLMKKDSVSIFKEN